MMLSLLSIQLKYQNPDFLTCQFSEKKIRHIEEISYIKGKIADSKGDCELCGKVCQFD